MGVELSEAGGTKEERDEERERFFFFHCSQKAASHALSRPFRRSNPPPTSLHLALTPLQPSTLSPQPPPPTHPTPPSIPQGEFPHYQQLFFCTGNVNIEGKPVDACVGSGASCEGSAAAAGFCRYLNFDGALPDQTQVSSADAGTPARSVTGEWCTGNGYDSSLGALDREGFEKLKASYGSQPPKPCSVLERVACYRSRESLAESWKAAGDKARTVAVEQSLPGPSVAPRVGGGGGAGGLAAGAAAVPAAATSNAPAAAAAAASSPEPAPRAADVSVSSVVTSDAVADEAKTSSGGRRLLLSA